MYQIFSYKSNRYVKIVSTSYVIEDSDLSQVLSDMNFIEQQLAATTASYRSFIKWNYCILLK